MASSMERMDNEDLEAVLMADDMTAGAFLRLLPHPADVVESLRAVNIPLWPRLLRLVVDEAERAEVLSLLDDGERQELLDLLEPDEIGRLVRNLETDDATDVIEDLEPQEQREALESMPAAERAQVEELLRYPPDTAGGIMQVERAQVREDETVEHAIARVQVLVEDDISVHYVYVVDTEGRLVGMVDLSRLLARRRDTPIKGLMEPAYVKCLPDIDQEEVASLFKKYGVTAVPVVNKEGRLLGRIVHDDVIHVVVEEAEEDALKQAGTSVEELLYADRVLPIARVRLPWLLVNLLGSMISATLLHLYEPIIGQALIIAAFVPVITAMGGNVGTQSATILTRGLATGRVTLDDIPQVLFREFRVGVLMGLLCGVAVGLISAFVFSNGRPYLGVVVFCAMLAAMTVAASVGALAPALMKRLGIDPAIASGPFVTTANDIIGIVIYMSTAIVFLEKLTP